MAKGVNHQIMTDTEVTTTTGSKVTMSGHVILTPETVGTGGYSVHSTNSKKQVSISKEEYGRLIKDGALKKSE